MTMIKFNSDHPCDICKAECDADCALWLGKYHNGYCQVFECIFNNSDIGCILGFNEVCKVSTCYRPEITDED